MTTQTENIYQYAIVGGGPAGVLFYNKLKEKDTIGDKDIIVFEKDKRVCMKLETYGKFFKNYNSIKSRKWDFLVSGNLDGKGVSNYFQRIYAGNIRVCEVTNISKGLNKSCYKLMTSDKSLYFAKKVVLATGLEPKELKLFDRLDGSRFDITKWRGTNLKKIDFTRHEIIFIGSGDNVLFKAMNLATFLKQKFAKFDHEPIIILAKNNIRPDANPDFVKRVFRFSEEGVIKIIKNCWDLKKVYVNDRGYISSLVSSEDSYSVKAKDGALAGIYIGYKPSIPKLNNCNIKDFVMIGDLDTWLKKSVFNLTSALENVEEHVNSVQSDD